MKKFKVQANIEIEIPVSKKRVETISKPIELYVEAENEDAAYDMLESRISFDYKFNITEC